MPETSVEGTAFEIVPAGVTGTADHCPAATQLAASATARAAPQRFAEQAMHLADLATSTARFPTSAAPARAIRADRIGQG